MGGGASFVFCLFCWFTCPTTPRTIGALLRNTSSVSFVLGLDILTVGQSRYNVLAAHHITMAMRLQPSLGTPAAGASLAVASHYDPMCPP